MIEKLVVGGTGTGARVLHSSASHASSILLPHMHPPFFCLTRVFHSSASQLFSNSGSHSVLSRIIKKIHDIHGAIWEQIWSSCNLRCRLIFLYGRSLTYCVASLRAAPVFRFSHNLYLWLRLIYVCYVCNKTKNYFTISVLSWLRPNFIRLTSVQADVDDLYSIL